MRLSWDNVKVTFTFLLRFLLVLCWAVASNNGKKHSIRLLHRQIPLNTNYSQLLTLTSPSRKVTIHQNSNPQNMSAWNASSHESVTSSIVLDFRLSNPYELRLMNFKQPSYALKSLKTCIICNKSILLDTIFHLILDMLKGEPCSRSWHNLHTACFSLLIGWHWNLIYVGSQCDRNGRKTNEMKKSRKTLTE